MRVLIISLPVWINENNSGNTLSNIFSDFNAEFANIYFSSGFPNNDICDLYFQVTDYMVINKLLKNKSLGKQFRLSNSKINSSNDQEFEKNAKRYKNIYATILREIAWKLVKIDNKAMYDFIDDFGPDIIYAPSYGSLRMQRIVRKIKEKTSLPLVSLISDDLYSYRKEMKFIEKIYQFFLRRSMQKTFKMYDKVYTMTAEQKEMYQKIFHCRIDLLRKSSLISYKKHKRHDKLQIIYAGGIYEGREKTLIEVTKAIKKANNGMLLDVYTASKPEDTTFFEENKDVVKLHKATAYDELIEKYQEHDIALHVESFEAKFAERTKLSFSTKIVDCLQSGGAVLAICPNINAGYKFLKKEQAAVCVDDVNNIMLAFKEIDDNYEYWQQQAYNCLQKNFLKKDNVEKLFIDFKGVIQNKKEG